jgi:hypothetical protein
VTLAGGQGELWLRHGAPHVRFPRDRARATPELRLAVTSPAQDLVVGEAACVMEADGE